MARTQGIPDREKLELSLMMTTEASLAAIAVPLGEASALFPFEIEKIVQDWQMKVSLDIQAILADYNVTRKKKHSAINKAAVIAQFMEGQTY